LNILDTIIAAKRKRLATATEGLDLVAYREQARAARADQPSNRLRGALVTSERPAIIAEIKRRSPSKGDLRPGLVPAKIAAEYERGGAAAISVLTEEDHFSGSLDDLRAVRVATGLPILRKDFIVDEFQIYEAALAGADALLLIVAALDDLELRSLMKATEQLGLDALVEVHTEEEMHRALGVGATLIGVNNRNLLTFEVSLDVSFKLAQLTSPETILVTESGIATGDDIRRLHDAGYRGFLIGETFMRAADPGAALRKLAGNAKGDVRPRLNHA
jgi:indole-3-glycerol phosphate synthase